MPQSGYDVRMTTFTKSTPPADSRGRSNQNLRAFKETLQNNPGEWFEYNELLSYNLQATKMSGFKFTARSQGTGADGKRIYKIWGRFDPVTSPNASKSA